MLRLSKLSGEMKILPSLVFVIICFHISAHTCESSDKILKKSVDD